MRATTAVLNNFKLSDSSINIKFVRNMMDGYQLLNDSLLIQDTPTPQEGKQRVMTKGDRVGIYVHQSGPLHLKSIQFKNYMTTTKQTACAIQFEDKYRQSLGSTSSVSGKNIEKKSQDPVCS